MEQNHLDKKKLEDALEDIEEEDRLLYLEYKEERQRSRKKRLILIIIISTIYALIIAFIMSEKNYVNKEYIQTALITAINKDATIDVIKNIYNNREITNAIKLLFKGKSKYYKYNTSLSQILYDIKSKYYTDSQNINDINIHKITDTIKNYLIINPYDSLELTQKDMFTNIRLKLNKNTYEILQNDLEKIAKELTQKNNLVNQYLKDSTNSFWISISALIFSALLGLYQLYLGREEKHRQIISDELKNIINDNKNQTYKKNLDDE